MEKNDPYIGPSSVIYIEWDNLPPHIRRIYWDNNIGPLRNSKDYLQQSALMDFGPDHPQAQGEFLCPLKR